MIGQQLARGVLRIAAATLVPKDVTTESRPYVDFVSDENTGGVLMNVSGGGKGKVTYVLTSEMLNAIFDIQTKSLNESWWGRTKWAAKEQAEDAKKAGKQRNRCRKLGTVFESTVSFLPHDEKGWVLMIVRHRFEENTFELHPDVLQDMREAMRGDVA